METRKVDDHVDWVDNTETPRLLRQYAYSPAVVR
jgi:hypothetical protein